MKRIMSKRLPISVFIIARDEADRIPQAIKSVRDWVDEVIVVDSGSNDTTVQVSEELGARVVFRKWEGYGPQKVYAEGLCRQRWILNIDADEAISPELHEEITTLFKQGDPEFAGFHIPIRIVFRFDSKPRPFAPSNNPVRLYDKQRAGFKHELVHDSVALKDGEKSGYLRSPMHHRCFRSYAHALDKINRYSSMQAEDMLAKGRCPSVLRVVIEPFIAFLKSYLLRRYVLFGLEGFIESVNYGYARFIRLAKTREIWKETAQTENARSK